MGPKHIPDDDIISGINITPMVDIMLVLLFIFMLVTTFVDMNGIPIDLPRAETGEPLNARTVSVMITRDRGYYLDGVRVSGEEELRGRLEMKKSVNPNIQVVIGADRMVYHSDVVNVIDMIRKINISRFAINVNLQDDFFRP